MTRSATAFAFGGAYRCHDRVDPDARSVLREVAARTAVVVANEIPGACAPGRRFYDLSPDPLCRRVLRVTLTWMTRLRPGAMKTSVYRAE
jgi:hypothetical protein